VLLDNRNRISQSLRDIVRAGAFEQHVDCEGIPETVWMRSIDAGAIAESFDSGVQPRPAHRFFRVGIQQHVVAGSRISARKFCIEGEEKFLMQRNPNLFAAFVRQPREHTIAQIDIRPAEIRCVEASQSGVTKSKKASRSGPAKFRSSASSS